MTDIVKRLRAEGAMAGHYDAPAIQREAAAEIEWLRGERNRLAADLAKAHREALAWMQKANQQAGESPRAREMTASESAASSARACTNAFPTRLCICAGNARGERREPPEAAISLSRGVGKPAQMHKRVQTRCLCVRAIHWHQAVIRLSGSAQMHKHPLGVCANVQTTGMTCPGRLSRRG